MITIFERQQFVSHYDPDEIRSYENIEFVKCKFYGGGFGYRHTPDYSRRTTAQNITIRNCEAKKFSIGPALLRDIWIENLKSDMILAYGPLLEHVKFRGRCGKWLIHGTFQGINQSELERAQYQPLCTRFYKTVDWAIDISEAEFEDFDLRTGGIPAKLVKRDPETQVIIRRERAMQGSWRELGLDRMTEIGLTLFLKEGAADTVLVVPKRMKGAKRLVEDLRKLQAAGIAEPD